MHELPEFEDEMEVPALAMIEWRRGVQVFAGFFAPDKVCWQSGKYSMRGKGVCFGTICFISIVFVLFFHKMNENV